MIKNRISAEVFQLPCPACILGRPLLLREEMQSEGVRPKELDGTWAVCQQGFHALNKTAEDTLRRLRG